MRPSVAPAQRARKAKALAWREVATDNEGYPAQDPDHAEAFKEAHGEPSPQTRQVVAALRYAFAAEPLSIHSGRSSPENPGTLGRFPICRHEPKR